jgi:hypothetical protein
MRKVDDNEDARRAATILTPKVRLVAVTDTAPFSERPTCRRRRAPGRRERAIVYRDECAMAARDQDSDQVGAK